MLNQAVLANLPTDKNNNFLFTVLAKNSMGYTAKCSVDGIDSITLPTATVDTAFGKLEIGDTAIFTTTEVVGIVHKAAPVAKEVKQARTRTPCTSAAKENMSI